MNDRFTVLIADFLDETSIESAVLQDIAGLVMARAKNEEDLASYLPNADAIMLFHDISIVGEPSFSRAPRCRCVVRAGVGFNNVDVDAATRHGVVVCNVPDYGTEEVADHAIMFLLAIIRRLMPSHQEIKGGAWDYRSAIGAPACAARHLAWSVAAGSGRRPPCAPRHSGWTSCSTILTCARGWIKRSEFAGLIRWKTCWSRAIM